MMPKTKDINILYYYCSMDTFVNIINNRTIWLPDVTKSNDSLEMAWYQGRCNVLLEEKWAKHLKNVGAETILPSEDKKYKALLLKSKKILTDCPIYVWACCFSERIDNLSQWRGYADDGRGVCIGFNKEMLIKHFPKDADTLNNQIVYMGLNKIKYNKTVLENDLKSVIDNRANTSEETTKSILYDMSIIVENAPNLAMLYKQSSFMHEREWRIIARCKKNQVPVIVNGKSNLLEPKVIGFKARSNGIVSHLEIGIESLAEFINEIYIGPSSTVSVQDVESFMIAKGVLSESKSDKIIIKKSQSSYRRVT